MLQADLLDRSSVVVATLCLEEQNGRYLGTINLESMPPAMRLVFEEWESLVSEQIFSLLDEADERIDQLGLRIRFAGGGIYPARDLQICPSDGKVAVQLAIPAALPARGS